MADQTNNNNGGHAYRLQAISDMKKQLENERDKRASLYKKYHRGSNILDGFDVGLTSMSMGMGVVSASLLATIVAAPISMGLIIGTFTCGTLSVIGKFISKRLAVKAKKHQDVKMLADSKVNTISDLVSSALMDSHVSDEEFKLIISEVKKYGEMKNDIRSKAMKSYKSIAISEEEKNKLIEQGKNMK